MSEQKVRREIPVFGIIVLFLGVLFLLQTLGVLSWALWGVLWRFWPVLIIIAGLGILLRSFNPWLVSLIILAVLSLTLGVAVLQYNHSPIKIKTQQYSQPLDNLESASVDVNFNTGSLILNSLNAGSGNLVEAAYSVQDNQSSLEANFSRLGKAGRILLTTGNISSFLPEGGIRWQVNLNRQIPVNISIRAGASNLDLNLNQLKVTDLQLNMDTGSCSLIMPASGVTSASIHSDVANLNITIPHGVAARIQLKSEITTFAIDKNRFPQRDTYYQSPDYETAANKLDLQINSSVASVQIK